MKYLNSKHERNSVKITTLIMLILVLLLFVVGPPYQDPPEEYGVSVNFGNSSVGSGDVQPTEPVKSEPNDSPEEPVENVEEPAEAVEEVSEPKEVQEEVEEKVDPVKEDVLTQEEEDAIKIKKQEEEEAKKKEKEATEAKLEKERIAKEKAIAAEKAAKEKQEQERIAKEKAIAKAKKAKEQADKKAKLDALMGGVSKSDGKTSGGEGNDNQAGDKGQLNGNPYATSYFGDPGTGNGGVGYGLNGRGRPSKQVYKQNCNESGLVVVRIEVDRNGNVLKATPGVKGTKNTAACLLEPAKKIALSHKWKPDAKAPVRQVGFVSVNFKLGQ